MRAAAGNRCQALLLRHWTTGRVLLASEAAHTVTAESSNRDGTHGVMVARGGDPSCNFDDYFPPPLLLAVR